MKRRGIMWVVSLLYLSVVVYFGIVHHHEDKCGLNEPDHCGACQWAMAVTSDVPVVVIVLLVALMLVEAQPHVEHFHLLAVFAAATASRAPPASPA